jgi:hypothetical protein
VLKWARILYSLDFSLQIDADPDRDLAFKFVVTDSAYMQIKKAPLVFGTICPDCSRLFPISSSFKRKVNRVFMNGLRRTENCFLSYVKTRLDVASKFVKTTD